MDPRYLTSEPRPRRRPKQQPKDGQLTVVGGWPLPQQGTPYGFGAPSDMPADWSLPPSQVGQGQATQPPYPSDIVPTDPPTLATHTSVGSGQGPGDWLAQFAPQAQQVGDWFGQMGQGVQQAGESLGQGVQDAWGQASVVGGLQQFGQGAWENLQERVPEVWDSMQESARSGASNPTIMGGGSGIPDFGLMAEVGNVLPEAVGAGVTALTGQPWTSPEGKPVGPGDIVANFVDPDLGLAHAGAGLAAGAARMGGREAPKVIGKLASGAEEALGHIASRVNPQYVNPLEGLLREPPTSGAKLRPGAELEQVAPGAYRVEGQDLPEGVRPQDVATPVWKPSNNPDPTLRAQENALTNPVPEMPKESWHQWAERALLDDKAGLIKFLDDAARRLRFGQRAQDLPLDFNPLTWLRTAPGSEEIARVQQRLIRPVLDIAKQIDPTPVNMRGTTGSKGEMYVNMFARFRDSLDRAERVRKSTAADVLGQPFGPVAGEQALINARGRAQYAQTMAQKYPNSPSVSKWISQHLNLTNNTIPKLEAAYNAAKAQQLYKRQMESSRQGNLAWASRRFPGNHSALEAQNGLQALEQQLGPDKFRLVEIAHQKLLQGPAYARARALDSGLISGRTYTDWLQNSPDYIPAMFDAYEKEGGSTSAGPGGDAILNTSSTGVKKMTDEGSNLSAIPPIQAVLQQMEQVERLASRNEAFTALADLLTDAKNKGVNLGLREVTSAKKDAIKPAYERPVQGFVDGRRVTYAVPVGMDAAFYLGEHGDTRMIRNLATWFGANLVRMMATGRNLAWAATLGPLRDYMSYGMRNAAWALDAKIPLSQKMNILADLATEYFKLIPDVFAGIEHGEYRGTQTQHALLSGIGMSHFSAGARKNAEEMLTHLRRDSNYLTAENPGDAWRLLKDTLAGRWVNEFSGRMELLPRVATQNVWERHGLNPRDAALRGRDVTLDFQRGGWFIRTLNPMLPFLNSGVQGPLAPLRMMKENPAGGAAVLGILGMVALADEAYNRSDPQRAYDYDNLPPYLRNTTLSLGLPGDHADTKGERRPNRFNFPLGEWAFVPNLVHTATKQFAGQASPKDWADLLATLMYTSPAAAATGIAGKNPLDTVINFLPPVLGAAIQGGMNRDTFTDRAIASKYGDERASTLSKGIAGAINRPLQGAADALHIPAKPAVSPGGLDWLGQQFGKAWADPVNGAVDLATGANAGSTRPQDWPIVGGALAKVMRDQTGGILADMKGTGGVPDPGGKGWPVLQAYTQAGVALPDPPYDIEYDRVPGTSLRLTDDDRGRYIKLTGQLITQMWHQVPPNLQQDPNTLKSIQDTAHRLASRGVFAQLPPEEMAKRLSIAPKMSGETSPPAAEKAALGLMTELHDTARYPEYAALNGQKIGTGPKQWAEWDKYLLQHRGDVYKPPQFKVLEDARARANVAKYLAMTADSRYDDYSTWLGKERGYSQGQIDDFNSGRSPKYQHGGPEQWRDNDKILTLARMMPSGPAKSGYAQLVKALRMDMTPNWKPGASFDELELRDATDELDALESQYSTAGGYR